MMGGKKSMMPKAPKPMGEVKRNFLPKGEMPMAPKAPKPMAPVSKAPKPIGEVKRNLLPKGEMPMTKATKPMMPKAPMGAPKGKGMAVSISVGMMKPMKKGKK